MQSLESYSKGSLQRVAIAGSSSIWPEVVFPSFDMALQLGLSDLIIMGGFQASSEQDVLEIIVLHGKADISICAARSASSIKRLYSGKLWQAVKQGIAAGRVILESPFPDTVIRATRKTAAIRNTWVVERADAVLILHATPGGETERMARLAVELGKPLATLDHPANQHLIDLGAYPTKASDPLLSLPERWLGGR